MKKEETAAPEVEVKTVKEHRFRHCLCVLSKLGLVMGVLLLGTLYWLLGTTSGSAFALKQASSLLEGVVGLEVPLVDGSILYGMKTTRPIKVEVPEIVSVTADSLDIKYNVFDVLTKGALVIDHLTIPNLKVALLIDIFEESAEEEEPEAEDETPFRLNIPVHIVLNNFKSKDFAFLFQVVDVLVEDLDLDLEVQGDYAGINRGCLDHLTVHLKDEIFYDNPEDSAAVKSAESAKSTEPQTAQTTSDNAESGETKDAEREVLSFDGGDGVLEPIGDIPLPLVASIKNLKVRHGRYYMSMVDTGIFNSTVNAMWTDTHLLVPEISVEHILGKGSLKGKIDFRDFMYFDFDLMGEGQRNAYTKVNFGGLLYGLSGQGKLSGNLTDLSLKLDLLKPQVLSTTVRLNCLSSQLPAELELKTAHFAYPLLSEEIEALSKQASVEEVAPEQVVSASEQNWKEELKDSEQAGLDPGLTDYQPEWMKLDTKKPEWITEQAALDDFSLTAQGSLAHGLETRLEGTVNGYGAEQIRLKLAGLVTLEGTTLPTLEASGSYNKLPFKVGIEDFVANYGSEVSVQGKLRGQSSSLKSLHPLLEGAASLGTDFAMQMVPEAEGTLKLGLVNTEAKFMLNHAEARVKAEELEGNLAPYLEIKNLNFVHRSNHVDLQGQLSPQSDLKAVFALKDLSEFSPDCFGQFMGQFTLKGDAEAPNLTMTAQSEFLKVQDIYIEDLLVNSSVSVPEEKGNLVIMSETLMFDPEIDALKQFGIEISGTLQKHRLAINFLGQNSAYLGAEGSYDKTQNIWSGMVRDFFFTTQYTKPIMLTDPIDIELNLDSQQGSLSAFELSGEQIGSLKVDKTTFAGEDLQTKLKLEKLNLKAWQDYLPKGSSLRGTVGFDCAVDIKQGKPHLSTELAGEDVMLRLPSINLGYKDIKFKADLTDQLAKADLELNFIRNFGRLDVNALLKDPMGAQQLSGKVRLDNLRLEQFAALGGGFNELSGAVNLDGNLGGVLASPLINGTLSIKGTAEPSYDIGRIEDFDLNLKALGQRGVLNGIIKLNEGSLNLDGDLDWSQGANGNLHIQSTELPVFLLGYGVAYTNVDSRVKLGEVLDITGQVEIPRADIRVKDVETGGIVTSKDEVLVDEMGAAPLIQNARQKPQAPLNSNIELKVKLGDDVKLRAMGLRARVTGGLELRKAVSEKDVKAEGVIELEDGEADLYGHHFIVNHARTIFKGDPTQPQLDCEVIADPSTLDEDIVAGVQVKGPAIKPEIELFSRPVMSRNEILSYMLYGHGLEKSSGNADNSSAELLMALGLGATTGVVNQMAGAFGMHNVTVGSSGTGDESKVGIQGYITKDIRVAYGYGLYNSVGEFSLRYELMRKFYVEVVSSLNQAVNLIYSFSF
ncbi:MAG: translocation/assembly module TamB domain-containing protein [Succinivibrio sp.]|nr:translocation/assembly module TamB domain-containing protein [Succinivibrio sp.]